MRSCKSQNVRMHQVVRNGLTSREMSEHMRNKDKLVFARINFASPGSRSQFYSLPKRKEWENSIESLM